MNSGFDIYATITDRMIDQLEQGTVPWFCPWIGVLDVPVKHRTGQPYSLMNQMLLGEPGEYMSFLECKAGGGTVRKGAKSRIVVFYKPVISAMRDVNGNVILDDNGKEKVKTVHYLRYSNVFHIRDCEGIAPKWDKDLDGRNNGVDHNAENVLADYIRRSGVRLTKSKQNKAYYSPALDQICVPLREQFPKMAEYYSTVFHEAAHSTGHPKRLNRFDCGSAAFGSDDYSREELVAEIASAAVLHSVGIETKSSFRNSVGYVQNWIRVLKGDKRMIVSAAARADKAVRMILGTTDGNVGDE